MADEIYLTLDEIAERVKLHRTTVRRWFLDETGVVRIGSAGRGKKRQHFTVRVPESVYRRVLQRMTLGGGAA